MIIEVSLHQYLNVFNSALKPLIMECFKKRLEFFVVLLALKSNSSNFRVTEVGFRGGGSNSAFFASGLQLI